MLRFSALASFAVVSLSAAPAIALAADSTVEYVKIESKSVGRPVDVGVYLPPGYDAKAERRYPVVYFLHGMRGSERKWEDRGTPAIVDRLIADKKIEPVIVVCPDGGNSFWMKWVDGTQDFESFVVKDLVAAIDEKYKTLPQREFRGINGDSMGGLGALNLGLRNTDVFGSTSAHSAALLPADPKESPERMQRMGTSWLKPIFGDPIDLEHYQSNNPIHLAATLDPEKLKSIAIYFDCGDSDRYGFDTGAKTLDELLEKRSIPHECHIRTGGHGADYFLRYVDQSLKFHADCFAKARKAEAKDGGGSEPPAKKETGEEKDV